MKRIQQSKHIDEVIEELPGESGDIQDSELPGASVKRSSHSEGSGSSNKSQPKQARQLNRKKFSEDQVPSPMFDD